MFELRPAGAADFDFLYELHEVTMRDYVQATWGWDDAFQRRMFQEAFDDRPRSIVIVDGADNGVLCCIDRADAIYVDLLEIHPRVQRRGVGAAVLRSVIDRAVAARRTTGLRVIKVNVGARRLYQRLGFVVVGETETHYDMRCG